jgi:hypothetical protein
MTTSNTLEHNELVRRAGRSAVMTIAAACAAAVLAGCAGGGTPAGAATGDSAAGGGSLQTFCTNYRWATDSFNKASGDPTDRNSDAGTDGIGVPSDSSTVQALAANVCNQLLNTVNSVGVLDGVASDFSSSELPALSQWQSSAASITAVAAVLASANVPQQLQVDVHTVATDVQDIIANGYSYPGVGDDVLTVKNDASQGACTAVTN